MAARHQGCGSRRAWQRRQRRLRTRNAGGCGAPNLKDHDRGHVLKRSCPAASDCMDGWIKVASHVHPQPYIPTPAARQRHDTLVLSADADQGVRPGPNVVAALHHCPQKLGALAEAHGIVATAQLH
eukprot:357516-Chlamydomonas_euryale.AAC.13